MIRFAALMAIAVVPTLACATPGPVDNSARYARTAAYFETVIQGSPKDAAGWLNLGMAQRALGREAAARIAFARVMRLENVTLQDRFGGDVWSHTLAREAIASSAQLTLR